MHRHLDIFTQAKIDSHVGNALANLLERDAVLFTTDANERSLAFRLALYLAYEFPDFDVDCEYNRHYKTHYKQLHDERLSQFTARKAPVDDENGLTVFPDIIVHRRESPENLLVVEIKKTTSNVEEDFDLAKLRAYRDELGYRFAKFIRLATGPAAPGIAENRFL
jgi:hypothetical protein